VQVLADKAGVLCIVDENNSAIGAVTEPVQKELHFLQGDVKTSRIAAAGLAADDRQPIVLKKVYENIPFEDFIIDSAIDFGSLLIDGIGEAIWPSVPDLDQEKVTNAAFGILQATRARITRTEFISCPSCGRTLFDIETTLKQIRLKTGHLKGLKIAVMGCIVNGPGEMADADYGYVGAGRGTITLYKGSEVVRKNIPQAEALDTLISLIGESGDWKEPENDVSR
jgi:(E)-4-hydroxy-3-methylbut-2-enyl-diphosphate synthase